MTDSYIAGNEPTKKLHTDKVTVTVDGVATEVHDEYVRLVDLSITPTPILANASGSTLAKAVVTPGNAIRLYAYSLSADPENTAKVIAGLRFLTGGINFATVPLSQYGGVMSHSYRAGRMYVQGAADAGLFINLSAAQAVYGNFETEEITP